MKNIIKLLCLFVLSLQLTGCGPALLSDEAFVEAAQGICQTLKTEITSLDQLDYAGKAEAYNLAAGALAAFEISEESAPQGTLLRTSLSELAKAHENFAGALEKALAKADMDTPAMLMFTEGGNVFATSGNIFDAVKLDIDNALVLELNTKMVAVEGAATVLGLEECAPEQLGTQE
jgi:hypothetical protein